MAAVRVAHTFLLFSLNIKSDSYSMRDRQVSSLLRISFGRLQFYRETHFFLYLGRKKALASTFSEQSLPYLKSLH